MKPFNEKCVIFKKTQNKDEYGSFAENEQNVGEFWCEIVSHEVFVKPIKGGQKKTEEIRIKVWLNREITNECNVLHNGVKYTILNVLHNRVRGITTILAIFNN